MTAVNYDALIRLARIEFFAGVVILLA